MWIIYKYQLYTPVIELVLPKGFKVLCIQVQNYVPYIWILSNLTIEGTETILFHTYGTGRPISQEPTNYIGTFQLEESSYVGHVFQEVLR